MKRTNRQVKAAINRIISKCGRENESFYTAIIKYWSKYDLTEKQCQYLNEIKNGLIGPKSI